MNDYENRVCWNEKAVLEATPRDAAALTPARFRAVHHPLRLLRRPLGERTGGQWTTEAQLAEVLAAPLRADGFLLVPIVGSAGTGKSHLVRWVHDTTKDTNGWEVRYLAKNRTSIRRVIEIVTVGQEGSAFDRAREALDTAPARHEPEDTLAERLLDELALLVAQPIDHADGVDAKQRMLLDRLTKDLPDVLRDPVVRRRLVAPGAVVPRLVRLALEGRNDGDGLDDDAIRITDDDLPLSFEEIATASKGAKDLLGKMASLSRLRDGVVEMVNAALPVAVKRIFVTAKVDLTEVLRDLRRALHEQGRELVLFIEDLTVLHGVEQEFLDALIEPAQAVDDPTSGRLCGLRVLFAVTEHHFDGLDTVRQRLDDAFWLDAPYGDEGMTKADVTSFVGRYLNVARLDADLPDGPVPNACHECEHREPCHAAFATSSEGFGLYPFNPTAVERLVGATAPERFDPRKIVRTLINRFLLLARSELDREEFPTPGLMEPFDRSTPSLDPLVVARLSRDRPGDGEAVTNLARYWADPVPFVADEILSSFGYRALDRSGGGPSATPAGPAPSGRSARRRPDPEPPRGGPEHRLSADARKAYVGLNEWAGGSHRLPAGPTLTLRKLVHSVVLKNLDGGAPPVNLGGSFDKEQFSLSDVYLDRSATVHDREGAIIELEPSADLASALQGLLLLHEGVADPRTDELLPFVAWAVERWLATTSAGLAARLSDPAVAAAVQGLALCAALSGEVQVGDDPAKVLSRLFQAPPASPPEGSAERSARSPKWIKLLEEAGTQFGELDRRVRLMFGESRGTRGQVRAVRADTLLGLVGTFSDGWEFKSTNPAVDRLLRQVEPAIADEWAALEARVATALPHVDLARPWGDQAAAVCNLLSSAARAGRLPDGEALAFLDGALARSSDAAQASLARARDVLGSDPPLEARLALLATDLPTEVTALADFVRRATAALDGLEEELRPDRPPADEAVDLAGVVTIVLERTTSFLSAAEELAP
jgi:hypothetical protein